MAAEGGRAAGRPDLYATNGGVGSGFASQNRRRVHLGLGQAAAVDSAVIRWPPGAVPRVRALAVDTPHVLAEPR